MQSQRLLLRERETEGVLTQTQTGWRARLCENGAKRDGSQTKE